MIITKQKKNLQIIDSLKDHNNIFIVGCGDCAKQCKTGGEEEIEAMADLLKQEGKVITGTLLIDVLCHELFSKSKFRQEKKGLENTDAVLVLACGAGAQSVIEAVNCPVIPGCDSLYLGNIKRAQSFQKKCSTCGECTVARYGGVCAVTRCQKGLVNGPCGGAKNGKCEVNPTVDCGWILIYEKLKSLNQQEKLSQVYPPRNHNPNR